MRDIRKHIAVIMVLLMVCAAFAPLAVRPADAATKYDLPSKITNYNYKKGKWVKVSYSKLTYTKTGYLKTVKHSDGGKMSLRYSFYKNGKLKKITCPSNEAFHFNKKGLATKYCSSPGYTFIKYRYKGSAMTGYWDRDEACWFKYSYVKYPTGKIKEIHVNDPHFQSEEPEYITTFDENGLLIKEVEVMSPDSMERTYSYTFDKKGRVKSVKEFYKYGKEKHYTCKYVFSYSKSKKTKVRSRYTSLINSHIGILNYGQTVASGGGYCDAIRFILPTS